MADELKEGPRGIGGWLILVVIGLVLSPFRIAYSLFENHWIIFRDGAWQQLTTPGTEAYHLLWAPLLVFEILGNLGGIALAVVTLVYLLRKSRRTPTLAILWFSWTLIFIVADFFLADLIPAVAAQNDSESIKELARSGIGALIWIPYFRVSKRVKATFVE